MQILRSAQMLSFARLCHRRGKRDMSSLQGSCTLCSILMLVGGNLAVIVKIHQESIDGTVGQSVLLPVSYRFSAAPRFPVSILWSFANRQVLLIACALQNCSLGAGGEPSNCSTTCFTHSMYRGRAELFPENGSLLLRDLQLNDTGVYCVGFRRLQQIWPVTLTVHEQRSSTEHPGAELGGGGGTATRIPCYVFRACYCFILLFLQLLFHLRWCRPSSCEASAPASRSAPGTESGQRWLQHGAAPR
ncbi:uncharacterized protein LJ206_015268 isoform 1-T3 [Theristicus caerulescens]